MRDPAPRPRLRDLGVPGAVPGDLPTGPHNAITDVAGVLVGHTTLMVGDRVRTGVTAIRPHPGNVYRSPVPGAVYVGNGYGKLAGSTQVAELGEIETPIVLTNTLGVARALGAVNGWTLDQPGNEDVRTVNGLVGETNDGRVNDIRGRHVREEHVIAALEAATAGPVIEGSVGAGTGTGALGWKGGIGTSSRVLPDGTTVGVLVQSNYGGSLVIGGAPVGRELAPTGSERLPPEIEHGSCMLVVATDAPVPVRTLERIAARAIFAMGRTGAAYSSGSGDYAIAFGTAPTDAPRDTSDPSPLFLATLDATEEAIDNSILAASTVESAYGRLEAVPIDRVRAILRRFHHA